MSENNENPENSGGEQAEQPAVVEQEGADKQPGKDARRWALFCHLSGVAGMLPIAPVVGSVIAPLIIWQMKKDDFEFVNEQGKEAVNFQISILIYAFVAALLCFGCVGVALLPAVYIFDLIFLLIAAVKANDGQHYRYPLSIQFIK
jgi:uncharacterized Tic20 family protein